MIKRKGNYVILIREVNKENHKWWHRLFLRRVDKTAIDRVYDCKLCNYEKHVQRLKGKICQFVDNNTLKSDTKKASYNKENK